MKTTTIILALALLAGLALANGKQGQTLDSLNMRYVWGMLGNYTGLALKSDSTVWTVKWGTDTLTEIIASNPAVIDTNFYDMDTLFTGVIELIDDSLLLVYANPYIRTVNINSSPPQVISTYNSSHLYRPNSDKFLEDSLLITQDADSIFYELAFFNISDPTNIDTFVTGFDVTAYGHNTPWHFAKKDNILYGVLNCSYDPGPYWPHWNTYIYIINVADYSNPVLDTVYEFVRPYGSASSPSGPSPCVIVDSFLFVAISNEEVQYHVEVYDISNPTVPAFYDSFPHSGGGPYGALDMDYQEPYLYVGNRIYDITDYPETDSLIGYYIGCPNALIPNGKYIYRIYLGFEMFEFYEWDSTLGILDEPTPRKTYEDMFLLPNPAYKMCNVRLSNPTRGEIEIYNILGQRVGQKDVVSFNTDYGFDLSGYSPGVYLISVKTFGERITKKLVVLG